MQNIVGHDDYAIEVMKYSFHFISWISKTYADWNAVRTSEAWGGDPLPSRLWMRLIESGLASALIIGENFTNDVCCA